MSIDFKELADDWGWPEWCATIYKAHDDASKNGIARDYSDRRLESLTAASFWLLTSVQGDAMKPKVKLRERLEALTTSDDVRLDLGKFIRELFQNAYDVRPDDLDVPLKFQIYISDKNLMISHNGRAFRGPSDQETHPGEMAALAEVGVSTKTSNFDVEGQYGVGFKGWVLFYDTVTVFCMDDKTPIQVSWKVTPDNVSLLENKFGETEQIHEGGFTTRYLFSNYHHSKSLPTHDEIVGELKGLTRFRGSSVEIILHDNRVDPPLQTTLDHNVVTASSRSSSPGAPENKVMALSNTEMRAGKTLNDNEYQAVQSEIKDEGRRGLWATRETAIRASVSEFIDERRSKLEQANVPENPWEDITPDDWFRSKRITVGLRLDPQSDAPESRMWLHRLAPIHKDEKWPGQKIEADTQWIVDGPFWLQTDRYAMSVDETERFANAEMLRQALAYGAPALAEAIVREGRADHLSAVFCNTPFDVFLEDENPEITDYSRIVLEKRQDLSISPKPYSEIFPSSGIFVDYEGNFITPSDAIVIPLEWHLDEEKTPLINWINSECTLDQNWAKMPCITDSSGEPRLVTKEDSAFIRTVPNISHEGLYSALESSGVLDLLKATYPSVTRQPWFKPKMDSNIVGVIIGNEPPSTSLLDNLWEICRRNWVVKSPNVALSESLESEEGKWNFDKDVWCIQMVEEHTEGEWVDVLIRIIQEVCVEQTWGEDGDLQYLQISENEIKEMAGDVNSSDCSWFACRATPFRLQGYPPRSIDLDETNSAVVLVKRNIRRVDHSICKATLTGWESIRSSGEGGADYTRLEWEPTKRDRARIKDRGNIIIPSTRDDEDEVDLFEILKTHGGKEVCLIAAPPLSPAALHNRMLEQIGTTDKEEAKEVKDAFNGFLLVIDQYGDHEPPDDISGGWEKIPRIIFTRGSDSEAGLKISYNGKLGQECELKTIRNQVGRFKNSRDYKHHRFEAHRESLHGHAMRIQKSEDSSHRTNALIQDLPLTRLTHHLPDQEDRREIATILAINEASLSTTTSKIEIVRGHKDNQNDSWQLKTALVLPGGDPRRNMDSFEKVLEGDNEFFDGLRNEYPNFGFGKIESPDPTDWLPLWIGLPMPVEIPEGVLAVVEGDISRDILSGSEKAIGNRSVKPMIEGMMHYLTKLEKEKADISKGQLLECCDYLGRVASLISKEQVSDLFDEARSQKAILNPDTRDGLAEWLDGKEWGAEKDPINSLRTGLSHLEKQDYNQVKQWISELDDPEEMWKLFLEHKLIRKGTAHKFNRNAGHFERLGARSAIDPKQIFVSKRTGKSVFHITVEEKYEDAVRWTIPYNESFVVILDDELAPMLEADSAKARAGGVFDIEAIKQKLQELEPGSEDLPDSGGDLEKSKNWGFFQCVLGLWEHSVNSNLDLRPCPIVKGNPSQQCQVFHPDGPKILLGKRGWDLGLHEGRLALFTADPENPTIHTQSNLSTMLSSDPILESFCKLSLAGQSGRSNLAVTLGLHEDLVSSLIGRFTSSPETDLQNPFRRGNEGDRWRLRMMDPALWRDHSKECVDIKDARKILRRYTDALTSLLKRGVEGPVAGEVLQSNLRRLIMTDSGGPDGRHVFEETLYRGVHSMLGDEPRINVTGDDQIRRTFIARRYQENDMRKELLDAADLRSFPGNILLLSPMTQNLHQNYSQDWGLKENKDKPLTIEIRKMLSKDRLWGSDDHLILRDVMVASGQTLDLKIHKYHALLIAALDWALEEALSVEVTSDE